MRFTFLEQYIDKDLIHDALLNVIFDSALHEKLMLYSSVILHMRRRWLLYLDMNVIELALSGPEVAFKMMIIFKPRPCNRFSLLQQLAATYHMSSQMPAEEHIMRHIHELSRYL